MAFTYSDEGFETSRQTIQQIREYGYMQTSATGHEDLEHTGFWDKKAILGDASSQAGCDANSYYLLWGVGAVTAKASAAQTFAGILYHGDAGVPGWVHVNDTPGVSTLLQLGSLVGGPFFWNTPQPLRVPNGTGIYWDPYSSTQAAGNLITLYYTLVK